MSIKGISPLHSLKGHQAPVITVEYAKTSFLGQDLLASGSGTCMIYQETMSLLTSDISEDNTCRIWDLKSRKVLKGVKNLDAPVSIHLISINVSLIGLITALVSRLQALSLPERISPTYTCLQETR